MDEKEKDVSSKEYKQAKKRQEKRDKKFNRRQEELDDIYRNEKQKSDFKTLLSRLKFETYTKRLVGVIVFVAIIDLQFSYVLAFMDKIQIAETLSTQICITLLGTVLVYMIRAYFDTKAEKRDEMIKNGIIVDKKDSIIPDEVIKIKIQEVIDNSGIGEHINSDNIYSSAQTENPDDSGISG